jgi:hypothetical protein
MAKFILLYKGPATPTEEITPEVGEQIMAAWGAWMGKVGDALVDIGAPFGGRTAVAGDGSATSASDLNGYTVVEASDIDAAKALCDGHPFLSDGTAKFAVEIYELAPIEM